MLLQDHNLKQFTEVLASNAPAPGGGSVAALNGALAAALLNMVGELTVGKEKYREFHDDIQGIMTGAKELLNKLLSGVDEDTQAYNKVSAVFAMPKDTPEEKAARSQAMQNALKDAAAAPLQTMKSSLQCLELLKAALGKTNPSCESDFGVAALCAQTSVRSAWLNVKINLSGIKDEAYTEKTAAEAHAILAKSEKLAEELLSPL